MITTTSSSSPSTERVLTGLASLQYEEGQLSQYLQALASEMRAVVNVDCVVISEVVDGVKATLVQDSLEPLSQDMSVAPSNSGNSELGDRNTSQSSRFRSHLGIPVQSSDGTIVGAIDLFQTEDRQFSDRERLVLELFSEHAAAVIERDRLQAKLSSLEEDANKFHALFEHSNDAIFAIAPKRDRIVEVNPQACQMLGYSREELLESVAISDVHPDEMPQLMEFSQRVAEKGHGWTDRLTCLTKSGSKIPAEISAAVVELGGDSYILASVRDTCERRQRMQLARLSLAVSEALVRGNTLGEVLQDCAEALVEHLDGSLARLWVLEEHSEQLELVASAGMVQSIESQYCSIPMGKWKIGSIAQSRKPYLTNQLLEDEEFTDLDWAEREGIVALAGYPLVVTGRLVGMMVLFSRVSLSEMTLQAMATIANGIAIGIDRKQTRQRAMQALRRLAEVGELAATIVHEVRNPLTTVLMGLMSFNDIELPERAQRRLALAQEEAERLQRLLNEILMYAKPQSVKKDRLELNGFIAELSRSLQEIPQAQGRRLECLPHAADVPLNGDRDKLKQVFINLVTNAFEAVPEGETVQLTIAPDTQSTGICVSIRNGGAPIPADVLPRLTTQPFLTTKANGNGLGLAIVKRIVEAHSGTFTIESSEELQGTRVRVVFPIAHQ
ncbi:MAG: ATP-binding protein [Cyanobacteria bacterium P01_E01_bin.34]